VALRRHLSEADKAKSNLVILKCRRGVARGETPSTHLLVVRLTDRGRKRWRSSEWHHKENQILVPRDKNIRREQRLKITHKLKTQ